MKTTLIFAALLVVAGCKVNINEPTSTTPSSSTSSTATAASPPTTTSSSAGATSGAATAGSTGKTTTGATTSGSSTASSSAPTSGTSSSSNTPESTLAAAQKKPGYNPNRIYQLSDLQSANLDINGQQLHVWLMDTDSKRAEGLMEVTDSEIKPDQGMLFVFPNASPQSFWMKHTLIPLDVAYIGADKKVVSTATMQPLSEKSVPSNGPAMYVLEMKVGTLQRLGIVKGTQIGIPNNLKAQDLSSSGQGMSLGG